MSNYQLTVMSIRHFALSATSAAVLSVASLPVFAQTDSRPRLWSIEMGIGGGSLEANSPDGQDFYISDDQYYNYYLTGSYFLSKRIALTGGIYFRQDGIVSDMSDGIGLKKVNRCGLSAGAKAYLLSNKWIIQPRIGASLRTNVLNLGTSTGTERHLAQEGYPGSTVELHYDVQCPALSVNPSVGVDIRLLSTLSLTFDYNLYYGFWGHNRSELRFLDGPRIGQSAVHSDSNLSTGFNIGLKLDFPTRKITSSTRDNLLMMLFYLFAPSYY